MKRKKCQVTLREELLYYVNSDSNVMRDVHWYITVDYQQIENDNIANQIHGFTIDYDKIVLINDRRQWMIYKPWDRLSRKSKF